MASKHLLPLLVFSILADTEEYLHKLAAKIASVKMAAEMDKAAKAAAEDARAKVGTARHAAGRELGSECMQESASVHARRPGLASTRGRSLSYLLPPHSGCRA